MDNGEPTRKEGLGARHRLLSRSSDEQLAGEACSGDSGAFGELAERHGTPLRRTLYRISGDCEMAKNAVQDALLGAWRSICSFAGRSKFSTWLTRIGLNEAYRELSARGRETCLDCEGGPAERLADPGPSPERVAESKEALDVAKLALEELPDDYREAVVLRDLTGFSTREAARTAGIGERALKSRLHRGRRALRANLDRDLVETSR